MSEPETPTGTERPPEPDAATPPARDKRAKDMAAEISKLETLEAEARTRRGRNLWVQVSRVGTLGWLLALPIAGGALLGHFLDRRLDTGLTFALALLALGIALAGYTLWRHANEFET